MRQPRCRQFDSDGQRVQHLDGQIKQLERAKQDELAGVLKAKQYGVYFSRMTAAVLGETPIPGIGAAYIERLKAAGIRTARRTSSGPGSNPRHWPCESARDSSGSEIPLNGEPRPRFRAT